MSDDHPSREEQDPTRRRSSRSVPPIIDLKADSQKGTRQTDASSTPKSESSAMPHRIASTMMGPLIIGALAGAIAGMIATFLMMSLPTKSKDDLGQRLVTVEAAQSLYATSDRALTLEQQDRAFEKKIITLEESATKYNQKFAELDQTNQKLSDLIASAQKTLQAPPEMQSNDALNNLIARIDALTVNMDSMKAETTHSKPDEMLRLTSGLILSILIRDRILKNEFFDHELETLNSLKIDGLEFSNLQNITSATPEPQKTVMPTSQDQASKNWNDRLLSALSRIVTISPVEVTPTNKAETIGNSKLPAINQIIDILTDRIKLESTKS